MAISGSGWRAIGSTSFCSSAALFLAGVEGGGEGLAGGTDVAGAALVIAGAAPFVIWDRAAGTQARMAIMIKTLAFIYRLLPRFFPSRIRIVLGHFLCDLRGIRAEVFLVHPALLVHDESHDARILVIS